MIYVSSCRFFTLKRNIDHSVSKVRSLMPLIRLVISYFISIYGFFLNLLMHSFFLTENTNSRVLLKQWLLLLLFGYFSLRSFRLWDLLVFINLSSKVLSWVGNFAFRINRFSSLFTFSSNPTRALLFLFPIANAYCKSSLKWLIGTVVLWREELTFRRADLEVFIIFSKYVIYGGMNLSIWRNFVTTRWHFMLGKSLLR